MSEQSEAGDVGFRRIFVADVDVERGVELVTEGFDGVDAAVLFLFASPTVDGAGLTRDLAAKNPGVPVVGCTTSGEFTERHSGTGGVAAAALPRGIATRAAASVADLSGGVVAGVSQAMRELEEQLGMPLYDADPDRYLGLVFLDGTHGAEEKVTETLGNLAPLLEFVGGSAGDDLAFTGTEVFLGERASKYGAVIVILELLVPFSIVKTCSFAPTGVVFQVTKADEEQRILWELNGRPAAEVYAEAVGCRVSELDSAVFMAHPFGLMIEGEPWIRSPQRLVGQGGLKLYCQMLQDSYVDLMKSTRLIDETAAAIREATERVEHASGAIMFNCTLRRLELDAEDAHDAFLHALGSTPTVGFHTYGETWGRHANQTLTGVIFG